MPMTNNYTLFYFYNNVENPVCELVGDDLLTPAQESDYRDIFKYLDNHMVGVSSRVVDKLIKFSEEILEK